MSKKPEQSVRKYDGYPFKCDNCGKFIDDSKTSTYYFEIILHNEFTSEDEYFIHKHKDCLTK